MLICKNVLTVLRTILKQLRSFPSYHFRFHRTLQFPSWPLEMLLALLVSEIWWLRTLRLPLNMVLFIQGEQMIASLTDHSLFVGGTFPGRPLHYRIKQQFSVPLYLSFNKVSSTFLDTLSCSPVLFCSKSKHSCLQYIRICVFLLRTKNEWWGQLKRSAKTKIFHHISSCSGSTAWDYRLKFPFLRWSCVVREVKQISKVVGFHWKNAYSENNTTIYQQLALLTQEWLLYVFQGIGFICLKFKDIS